MVQTTVLPSWRATYPIQAPAQKPGGTTPNKALTASGIAWATGLVTVTTPAHNIPVGSAAWVTLSGFAPAGYNGQYLCNVASATTLTYPLTSNPGTATTQGSVSYMVLPASAVPNAG